MPRVRTERYAILTPVEECDCDHCGYPLYVGDVAVVPTLSPFSRAYCSTACALAELAGHHPSETIARNHA